MAEIININDYREGRNLSHCPMCCACHDLGYAICSWQIEWCDNHMDVIGLMCMNPDCTYYTANPKLNGRDDEEISFEADFMLCDCDGDCDPCTCTDESVD